MLKGLIRLLNGGDIDVVSDLGRKGKEIGERFGEAVGKNIGDKVVGRVFDQVLFGGVNYIEEASDFLVQIGKSAKEDWASELGISSRELDQLTIQQQAQRLGLTEQQLLDKRKAEAEQYQPEKITNSIQIIKERSVKEKEVRTQQAESLGISVADFDQLTLMEQAEKLGLTLDQLREVRQLKF